MNRREENQKRLGGEIWEVYALQKSTVDRWGQRIAEGEKIREQPLPKRHRLQQAFGRLKQMIWRASSENRVIYGCATLQYLSQTESIRRRVMWWSKHIFVLRGTLMALRCLTFLVTALWGMLVVLGLAAAVVLAGALILFGIHLLQLI